jgi:hypothetical protein
MSDLNNETKKSNKRIIVLSVVIGLIFLISLCAILLKRTNNSGNIAYIYKDGELIQTIDLSTTSNGSFDITGGYDDDFEYNTVTIKDGDICVSDSNCKNKLCVKEGYAIKAHIPIVCLPHKLVIVVKNENEEDSIDAITY